MISRKTIFITRTLSCVLLLLILVYHVQAPIPSGWLDRVPAPKPIQSALRYAHGDGETTKFEFMSPYPNAHLIPVEVSVYTEPYYVDGEERGGWEEYDFSSYEILTQPPITVVELERAPPWCSIVAVHFLVVYDDIEPLWYSAMWYSEM